MPSQTSNSSLPWAHLDLSHVPFLTRENKDKQWPPTPLRDCKELNSQFPPELKGSTSSTWALLGDINTRSLKVPRHTQSQQGSSPKSIIVWMGVFTFPNTKKELWFHDNNFNCNYRTYSQSLAYVQHQAASHVRPQSQQALLVSTLRRWRQCGAGRSKGLSKTKTGPLGDMCLLHDTDQESMGYSVIRQ